MSDLRRAILLDWMIVLCFVALMFAAVPQIIENFQPKPEVVATDNVEIPVLLGDVKGRVITGTLTLSDEDAATFMTPVKGVGTWRVLAPREVE